MFPDLYTQIIYDYISRRDGETILYKNIMEKYKMSYPTIRKKVNWLVKNRLITKNGRKFHVLPFIE